MGAAHRMAILPSVVPSRYRRVPARWPGRLGAMLLLLPIVLMLELAEKAGAPRHRILPLP